MRTTRFVTSLLFLLSALPSQSFAHFLWIAAGPQAKDGKVHVYFSETVSPDDPDLLDKVANLQLWQINGNGKATLLKTTKDAESLAADPIEADNPVFALTREYGVMSRGNDTFLLKYHAKCQPSSDPQSWRGIGNVERLPMEVVARSGGDQTVVTVLWQGKALPDSLVTITGPGIDNKLEITSNEKGEVSFASKAAGLYSIRAKYFDATTGELDGKQYSSVRHYSTLALSIGNDAVKVSRNSIAPVSTLPPLDPGITSFGAAILGDNLYLYGGHFGQPHHYSKQGQSDQLLRLNLSSPAKWDVVSTGHRRTGLAAVAHAGKFYRIGGFEARNEDADKQSLWSMSDFARFDPASNQWEQLPSMPAGRSSHDALVVGNRLYVVGGWELQGEGSPKWHDTAYVVDLSATGLEWKDLPNPPFRRRALSLGECQGKVYVIGGMQPEGGATTETAIYDPTTNAWSIGPKLNGEPMEGFGSSAFLCGKNLCATTFAGNVQILAQDGTKWVNAGKLTFPRFFHRMLPVNESQALIVGGASMKSGKIRELETISVVLGSSSD